MWQYVLRGFYAVLLLLGLFGAAPAADVGDAAADERMLREARIPTDGPGLLEFLRSRTVDATDEARLRVLVRQLGDDSFEKREQATAQLVAAGVRAKPFLEQAAHDSDLEVAHRARECRQRIEQGSTSVVLAAAVRTLARQRPAGAAQGLLNYLPSAEDQSVAEEVRVALAALAVRDGKAEPALLDALGDQVPVKRAAAAVALCRADLPAQLPAVRKLLRDPDPAVRLRVALALTARREKEAIPVLIALLDQPPSQEMGLVEDLLYRLAGDRAPAVATGNDKESRARYRAAWEDWWKEHGARIDLARIEEASRNLGYTLVVLLDAGKVIDLDASNRPRFEIPDLQFPLDAQLLPGDRVLVAEHKGNVVTERNRKGEVLWKKQIEGPLAAQRLPNGNTFIVTRSALFEVDKTGRTVFTHSRPGGEAFMKAQKLSNGDIACVTLLGVAGPVRFVRLDRTGKELKSFGVQVKTSGGRVEVLPNGHVLIPEMDHNRVVEYDAEGKQVREASVPQPIAAVSLPNGHWLVTSMNQLRAVELDRKGKEVWQYRADTRVTRAFRR
jgi:hypothetical protein